MRRLERSTRSLPPVVRQAGWKTISGLRATAELGRWFATRRRYGALPHAERLRWRDTQLELGDRLDVSPVDRHYFYQDVWAARHVAALAPERHVDVGSRVDLVGFLTAICPVAFVDIRPLEAELEGLEPITGSVLDLPFADHTLSSVSCLHVIEHIGLGRYGDPLDPRGSKRALSELGRVVAPGGQLLVSTPVGAPRVCFNAHRIHDPSEIPRLVGSGLELVDFDGVDDAGNFRRNIDPASLAGSVYACGMYRFARPA